MKILLWVGRILLGLIGLIILAIGLGLGWWRFGDWQSRAVGDVEFLHATIMDHHPGPVDPENPAFRTTMDEALANAMPLAEAARTPTDHEAALDAYTKTFNDGHLGVIFAGDVMRFLSRARGGSSGAISEAGIQITDNEAWITIPSFVEQTSTIASITQQIEADAEALRDLDRIVFDVRGNGGGDSSFANRIAIALWSQDVYLDWVPSSAAGVDWRATAENAEHVHGIAKRHADRGRESSAAAWTRVAEGIEAAVAAGEDYSRQNFSTREVTRTAPSPVSAQVVVITDNRCASSCLDFMDKLMALPGTLHIGEETSSDTQYIDVRMVRLPSSTGVMVVPLKVYRDRLRPSGGTYVPDVSVDASSLTREAVTTLLETENQSAP